MTDWIERYIHDVARRLPEKDRLEVERELHANIHDMLPDNPSEEDIKAVLREMGPPARLAEQYRSNPRYLISPASYGDYINVLKWLIPLVGGICLAVGLIIGAIESMADGRGMELPFFLREMLENGIELGVSGAFQALFWATLGFAIADRSGYQSTRGKAAWRVEDLPEVPKTTKGKIPLSDSVAELVVTLVFTLLGVLLFVGGFPFVQTGDFDMRFFEVFTPGFTVLLIPAVLIGCALQVVESVTKIAARRWSPSVCVVVILNNLISVGMMIFLFTRENIFSEKFLSFLGSREWGSHDIFRFLGNPIEYPALAVIAAIVIIVSLAECCTVIYRTVRASE